MSLVSVRTLAFVAALCLLGACDSAEERAEAHYQSALSLMAEGDTDRALVELRNVFDLNGFHKEARKLYRNLRDSYREAKSAVEPLPSALAS